MSRETMTVLVTDDDPALSRLLKANLESSDFRVLEATSGFDCIATVKAVPVDMVFLDVRLPDFSGWGVLGLLKLTDSLRHIPVIVASGDPPNYRLIQTLKPEEYMQKPFDIRYFISRVKTLVSAHNGEDTQTSPRNERSPLV